MAGRMFGTTASQSCMELQVVRDFVNRPGFCNADTHFLYQDGKVIYLNILYLYKPFVHLGVAAWQGLYGCTFSDALNGSSSGAKE